MATVRFSKELMESIEKNARAKMQPAVERERAQKLDSAWGQRIYDTLFFDVKPLVMRLPDGWVEKTDEITIDKVGSVNCGMKFPLAKMPWPRSFTETDLASKPGYYGNSIVLKDRPTWAEFKAEVMAYNERVQAAMTRQREFVDMVKKVVESFATLAPALKAWPPLWELIPEDVKEKHKQVVVREKAEVQLNVDLGKLTALSTAAKFGI